MKRAPFIVIMPVALLLGSAAWLVSAAAAQETPKGTTEAPAAPSADTPPAAPSAAATPEAEKPMPEIVEAAKLFDQRDVEGAIAKLKEARKKNPDLAPPQVIIAEFFGTTNRPVGMQNALEQAVVEYPDDPQAYFVMGELAMRDRRFTEARLLYEKADSLIAKLDSAKRKKVMQWQILNGMAMTAAARQDWAAAQKHIEAWLNLDSKSALAMQQLAQILLQQKKETAAIEQLVQARKIDPKIMSPEAILARYYAARGEKEQQNAKKWMKEALAKDLQDIRVRLLVAQWAWENGELKEAKTQADAALKLDEKLPEKDKSVDQSINALVLRGLIALFQKDYEGAEGFFQSANILRPNNLAATNGLALALIEQKGDDKHQRAFAYAQDNAQKYQRTNQANEALSTYGWILYKIGKTDDANRVLRQVISSGTFSADTAYYMARVLVKLGDSKNARDVLERALKASGPFQNREEAASLLEELKK
jgi:tetratricopeptide (TPR) repeat protein